MITFDLNINDSEALLHHCKTFKPESSDVREDSRLENALQELAQALEVHLRNYHAQRQPD